MWQAKYLARRIEMFNADFHVPVLWGLDAHSNPLSDVYHIITTGFMPRTILPPREPPRPDARIISMASIKVSWEHPDPGDAPIDHYRVERRAGRNRVVGYILFDRIKYPATSCLVTGLASGVSYEFRVIGVSSVGVGLPSPPSAPVTTPKIRENPAESRELDLLSVGSLGVRIMFPWWCGQTWWALTRVCHLHSERGNSCFRSCGGAHSDRACCALG